MSGLEKFQANEKWRSQFKQFLLMDRKPIPQPTAPIIKTQHYSLDIEEDLKTIIETKISQKSVNNIQALNSNIKHKNNKDTNENVSKMFAPEDKENKSSELNKTQTLLLTEKRGLKTTATLKCCDETTYMEDQEDVTQWQQRISDESFEVMEKMCDKTVSDPNSTLYQYMHSENKEQIVEKAKQRSLDMRVHVHDEEANALERLLNEFRVDDQTQLENESPLKGVDVTQLDDIEAPSRLWESTLTNETTLQTSPVKMVGLLRPSTILEEGNEESTTSSTSGCTADISSLISFLTVSKHNEEEGATAIDGDEVASSCYDTAHDSTATSSNVACADNNAFCGVMQSEELMYFDDDEDEAEDTVEISRNLIDLEATFGPNRLSPSLSIELEEERKEEEAGAASKVTAESIPRKAPIVILSECDSESESSDSIIVIESGDEDGDDEMENGSDNKSTQTPIKHEKVSMPSNATFDAPVAAASTSMINSDNATKSLLNVDDDEEKSLHFNDTMEEVEYMMKKGMEYMAAAAAAEAATLHSPAVDTCRGVKENKLLQSPRANEQHYRAPSPMLHKHKPIFSPSIKGTLSTGAKPKTTLAKPKPVNRFDVDVKPMPKLDLFKRPLSTHSGIPTSAGMRHHKELTHKQFSHIVSPIGAYMKKTATTPLMATMKDTPSDDAHNATVFRELEFESRTYHPKFEIQQVYTAASAGTTVTGSGNIKLPVVPSGLPKKAYISSQFKHIVDERTPVTIPGGKKIQKYLETAMLPAVVRHDGKLKMPANAGVPGAASSTYTTTHPNNASLADLSLMSGDVSMYTIRDAQKFQH